MQIAFEVIVIGGGHAGVEAAWAAANILRTPRSVALVTLDPAKIGVMSCNPAIGGLAKGQLVREIDAMGGLMGLAADATGIQFKVLNRSKGAAVYGHRAQCDKHAYAEQVQALLATRPEITIIPGSVERLLVEKGRITGVNLAQRSSDGATSPSGSLTMSAPAVVLTTGTFMRGLMHTGESKTPGGRHGEAAAHGISDALRDLSFELGRLKTGTPPRLKRSTIRWNDLPEALGDENPEPFSDLSATGTGHSPFAIHPEDRAECRIPNAQCRASLPAPSLHRFPTLSQVDCRETRTSAIVHDAIRANLHRAPMYSGQIDSVGPRYCPSIEDKVVRFADRSEHVVYLEPESLRDDWIYCNGISTSLPRDVQDAIVRALPGCEHAEIYRYGYAVEYDMVRPHQIRASGMTKLVEGLFLAGQINGTSGYEEAAAQGLVAGINAARFAHRQPEFILARDQAYIGVLMDDLVTKTPVEPYRMFTSRAEHRLLLRPDTTADRLTPLALTLGLLGDPISLPSGADAPPVNDQSLGQLRQKLFAERTRELTDLRALVHSTKLDGTPLADCCRRTEFTEHDFARALEPVIGRGFDPRLLLTVYADHRYAPYVQRMHTEIKRRAEMEHRRLPRTIDYTVFTSLRPEARRALDRFRPETFGQAGRLEGITPADLTLLAVLVRKHVGAERSS